MPIYLDAKQKQRQSFYPASPKLKSIKGKPPTTMTVNLNISSNKFRDSMDSNKFYVHESTGSETILPITRAMQQE